MTFEEAVKISIRQYYENGDDDLEHSKLEKDRKYNKKYFDDFESELMEKKSHEKK
jgi:hypothetical protein